jgi:anti-sigma factor RsiW
MTGRNDHSADLSTDQDALVAYLDGELDSAGVQQVEERLARDDTYRQMLQELQRSWDLLDDLPQQAADEALTRTTVEMVALQTVDDMAQAQPRLQRRRRWQRVLVVAIGLSGLFCSYWLVRSWLDRPNRQFLEDLPVIERVDLYQYVDNLAFLEALAEEGLFDEDVDAPLAPPPR